MTDQEKALEELRERLETLVVTSDNLIALLAELAPDGKLGRRLVSKVVAEGWTAKGCQDFGDWDFLTKGKHWLVSEEQEYKDDVPISIIERRSHGRCEE